MKEEELAKKERSLKQKETLSKTQEVSDRELRDLIHTEIDSQTSLIVNQTLNDLFDEWQNKHSDQ